MQSERWPPIYDTNELASTITELVENQDHRAFFGPVARNAEFCQGDVIELPARLPHVDANGRPAATQATFDRWLIVGNTCDMARSLAEVEYTQVVPLRDFANLPNISQKMQSITSYRTARGFYVPSWDSSVASSTFVADFTAIASIHRGALASHAEVLARLSYHGWILLHSCLVRFLARDDGRFD